MQNNGLKQISGLLLSVNAPNWFKCDHCDYTTNWKFSLHRHNITTHPPNEKIIVSKMEQKRSRSRNFTENEKSLLFELVTGDYIHIIENKQTDAVTTAKKKLAWEEITQVFNTQSQTGYRTAKQLHALYDNLKKLIKSTLLADKKNAGGGPFTPKSCALDDKIISNFRAQLESLQTKSDSSATYLNPRPACSKDADTVGTVTENFNVEDMPIEFEDVPVNEASYPSMVELGSELESDSRTAMSTPGPAAMSPEIVPTAAMGRKRKASIVVLKEKTDVTIKPEEQLHEKRLEILTIEKETKLKQLAAVEQQLEQERKLFELNYQARLDEIAFERRVREIKIKKLQS